jgi:hypothetical protein
MNHVSSFVEIMAKSVNTNFLNEGGEAKLTKLIMTSLCK